MSESDPHVIVLDMTAAKAAIRALPLRKRARLFVYDVYLRWVWWPVWSRRNEGPWTKR